VGGLAGGVFVLQNNGGDDLGIAAAGPFTFATALESGQPYHVTVLRQPAGHLCSVQGGDGIVAEADVSSVVVVCLGFPFGGGLPGNPVPSGMPAR